MCFLDFCDIVIGLVGEGVAQADDLEQKKMKAFLNDYMKSYELEMKKIKDKLHALESAQESQV